MKHDEPMDPGSMGEQSMGELMGKALREVDPPPPTPREELWARIQAARAAADAPDMSGHLPGGGGVTDLSARRRRTAWVVWSAAIAATLVLGIGLGRMSHDTGSVTAQGTGAGVTADGAPGVDADPVREVRTGEAVPAAYRLAAATHLERTETLLASLSVGSRPGGAREMSSWARELLTDTRLLLSSPAAQDAATRRLLEDLELILAQVAGIPEARAEQEVELIHEGINQSDVLLRLRAATAGPRLVGT